MRVSPSELTPRPISCSRPTVAALFCFCILGSGVLIGACDSSGSNGGGPSSLVPLEDGKTWTYRSTNNFNDTSENITVEANGTGSVTVTVSEGVVTYTVEENDNQLTVYPSREPEEEVPFKFPANSGDTYTFQSGSPDGELHTVEVSRESVTVPAGSFDDCLVYRIYRGSELDQSDEPRVLYFKPGVGLIQVNEQSRPDAEGNRVTRQKIELLSTSADPEN